MAQDSLPQAMSPGLGERQWPGTPGLPHPTCEAGVGRNMEPQPGPSANPPVTAGRSLLQPGPRHPWPVVCPGGTRAVQTDSCPLGREFLSPRCPQGTSEEKQTGESTSVWPGRRGAEEWSLGLQGGAPGQRKGPWCWGGSASSAYCRPSFHQEGPELRRWGFLYTRTS